MSDSAVSFDWNGEQIRFHDWGESDLGEFQYTTRDRRYDFKFELARVGREVRIYILDQPSYRNRSADLHSTHRLSDSNGHYICVKSNLKPENVPDALSWLIYWAEETGKYISTGGSFS